VSSKVFIYNKLFLKISLNNLKLNFYKDEKSKHNKSLFQKREVGVTLAIEVTTRKMNIDFI
jgi:hypothetical protein